MEQVLKYAQSELSARGEENPQFLEELEQSLGLLAFDDAANCPFSELLQPSQRLKVITELNAALLASHDQEALSKLSTLMKLVLWSQDQLEKKGITFPKLTNIADGKLTQYIVYYSLGASEGAGTQTKFTNHIINLH